MASNDTVLDLLEIGIVPQSARQAGQTLTPRSRSTLRELADGTLVSRERPAFQKYDTTVSFNDMYPPAFDNVHAGKVVTIYSICELSGQAGQAFGRPHVPGSVTWRNDDGGVVASLADETQAPVGATFYSYRPILVTLVESWDMDFDEYGAVVSGSLNLKER